MRNGFSIKLCPLVVLAFSASAGQALTPEEAFNATVADYNAMSSQDQGETIYYSLNAIYNYMNDNGREAVAKCMLDLYQPPPSESASSASEIISLVVTRISVEIPENNVLDVIGRVIERACGQ